MTGLLALAMGSKAVACDIGPMVPLGSVPADGGEIPIDGRILILTGDGSGDAGSYMPIPFHQGGLADGSIYVSCASGAVPDVAQCVYVFEPAAPLIVGDTYTIELREDDLLGDAVQSTTVTAVDRTATRSGVAPDLELPSFEPIGSGSDCDLESGFRATLQVTADAPDPDGLSYVRVFQQVEGADHELVSVVVLPADSAGPVDVQIQTASDGCFEAEHVDGSGQVSPLSEPVCGAEDDDTLAPPEDDLSEDAVPMPSVGCGCDSAGASSWGWLLLVVAGRRRRGRRIASDQ